MTQLNIPESLNIFENISFQNIIETSEYQEISPLNSIQNNNLIEFRSLGANGVFKALNSIYLYAEVQILKSDDKLYTKEDVNQGYLVNNGLFSIIKSATVYLNNVAVANYGENYSVKDYIESTLNFDELTTL